MSDFMHHEGQSVFVRGYSGAFNRFSVPLDCNNGRREIIRPGAFDRVILVPPLALACSAYHLSGPGFASMRAGNLKIWADDYGLAFEAGPFQPTPVNRHIVAAIVRNELRACSWLATFADSRNEMIDGEEVHVIRKFESVDHISPVPEGAYPDACCWCSHEVPFDLPPLMRPILDRWHRNRPTARSVSTPRRSKVIRHSASRPIAQAVASQVDPQEWAGPPPRGLTLQQWLDFSFHEAAGRRALQQQKSRDRARVRRRAGRRAGAEVAQPGPPAGAV